MVELFLLLSGLFIGLGGGGYLGWKYAQRVISAGSAAKSALRGR